MNWRLRRLLNVLRQSLKGSAFPGWSLGKRRISDAARLMSLTKKWVPWPLVGHAYGQGKINDIESDSFRYNSIGS
jgi:hypothetical protein